MATHGAGLNLCLSGKLCTANNANNCIYKRKNLDTKHLSAAQSKDRNTARTGIEVTRVTGSSHIAIELEVPRYNEYLNGGRD